VNLFVKGHSTQAQVVETSAEAKAMCAYLKQQESCPYARTNHVSCFMQP